MRYHRKFSTLSGIISGIMPATCYAVLLLASLAATGGCTRKIYMPAHDSHTRSDTLIRNSIHTDSVIIRDSASLIQRGDTIYLTRFRDRLRYRSLTDTVCKTIIDTVRITQFLPAEKSKTDSLSFLDKAKHMISYILYAVILILAAMAILRFARRSDSR